MTVEPFMQPTFPRVLRVTTMDCSKIPLIHLIMFFYRGAAVQEDFDKVEQ